MVKSKKNLFLSAAVILLAASGCSQGSGAPTFAGAPSDSPRTITVVGEGTAYGEPDQVSIQVGVETYAETVVDATNQNEEIMATLYEVLTEEGISPDRIQTSNFSVWGESQYMEGGFQGIMGYRVNNQLNIRVSEVESLGDILQATMDAGANSIYGINFGISDPGELETEARQLAVEDAREVAEELAALSGLEIVSVLEISELSGFSGMAEFAAAGVGGGGDAAAPSIAPGQVSAHTQVQVIYSVK